MDRAQRLKLIRDRHKALSGKFAYVPSGNKKKPWVYTMGLDFPKYGVRGVGTSISVLWVTKSDLWERRLIGDRYRREISPLTTISEKMEDPQNWSFESA